CARCHSLIVDGLRRSGPHFSGLFGRRVGSVPGYNYSAALRDRDFVWDDETLYSLFHEGPDVFLPGTKMPVQRIPSDEQLAQLIDYLREITAVPIDGAGTSD
ncbi:MAG: cytochrome C, partial [Alphaproteobacteria bacterium]